MVRRILVTAGVVGVALAALLVWAVVNAGGTRTVKKQGPRSAWVFEDSWVLATAERQGKPLVARFNLGLRDVAGHPAYRKQLGIAVKLVRQDEDGMPAREEEESLEAIEERIVRTFESQNMHLFAGVITTGGMREFVVYTSNAEDASLRAMEVVRAFPERKIQWIVNDDREWEVFRTFAGQEE